jgi:hypothetical protein
VHDELHPSGFVEEALEDDVVLRRQNPESADRSNEVVDDLRRGAGIEPASGPDVGYRRVAPRIVQDPANLAA